MATAEHHEDVDQFDKSVEQEVELALECGVVDGRMHDEFCAYCRIFALKASTYFSQIDFRQGDVDHCPNFSYLQESSRTCGLCELFMNSLKDGYRPKELHGKDFLDALDGMQTLNNQTPSSISTSIRCGRTRSDGFRLQIAWETKGGPGWYGRKIRWWPLLSAAKVPDIRAYYIEDRPSTATILSWLQHCKGNHGVCRQYRQDYSEPCPLPSRVLDLGGPNSMSEPHLFISNGKRAPYVCLSHCWGSTASTLVKTTKENLETRTRGIPLSDLPQTFLDAVKITRSMNVRYLWIDSLCIIQNDTDDWQKEAAAMASVYGNSYLTIAATAAKDSNGGCLRSRRPSVLFRQPQRASTQSQRLQETVLLFPESNDTCESLIKAPLNTRGWSFQEHVLPCRTLNFCEDQMLWHCLERTATEDGVIDFPGYILDERYEIDFFMKLGPKIGLIQGWNEVESQRSWWWTIVKEFTSRKLTKISDRLPALAGIIIEFHQRTLNTPIAGLWKNDLHHGLLWQSGSRTMKRPEALSEVPSWSWVAIEGPVFNRLSLHRGSGVMANERRSNIEPQALIITAEAHHSEDVFSSPIIGGTISLLGRLQPATRSKEDVDFRIYTLEDIDISYFGLLAPSTSTDLHTPNVLVGWCTFDVEPPSPDRILWCLEISISKRESEKSLNPFKEVPAPARTHDVLILETLENSLDTYRRIGVGVIHVGTDTFQNERVLFNIV